MWSELEKLFINAGLEYARQGSYSSVNDYPDSFFTFWNYDTPEEGFYDNESNRAVWYWNVYYYTSNPSTLYSVMDDFISQAKAAGFIPEGRGVDIPSDTPTHSGRMVLLKYIQNL